MTAGWSRLRASALDSVSTLRELLADMETEDRRLISAYLETKQILANAFEVLAAEKYADPSVLDGARRKVEAVMGDAYSYLPAKYLKVRGYGKAHRRLVAYLARSQRVEVSAAELRMLTGDAVHTERRVRELRDLGFHLGARHTAGADVYMLLSAEPNVSLGAGLQVARNIRGDRSISAAEAADLIRRAGLT
jgi:hypothetical protein